MNDPVAEAAVLATAHRHHEALAVLDRSGSATPAARLLRGALCFSLEHFARAHDLCQRLWTDPECPPRDAVGARTLAARILLRSSPRVDEAVELALAAAAAAPRLVDLPFAMRQQLVGEAQLELVHGLVRKGAPATARRWLQAAHEALGDDGRVLAAAGRAALAMDMRSKAKELFERALASGPVGTRLGRLGLAHVEGLGGDFAAAHAHLAALAPCGADDREVQRCRLRLLQAQGRWPEVVAGYDELLARGGAADTAAADRYQRAVASYRAGNVALAATAWRQLALAEPRAAVAPLANRHVQRLERPAAGTARQHRLAAFPSVAQLHNHCGPAAVELYLRFFGLPAAQVEVARAVQVQANGTPVYRLRRYLEGAGFATRRIEADLPVMRRVLDAGIPVLFEEDYSESRHAAVAIGYDDALEVLVVQDPMSHEVRETPYEYLATLRGFSNHGALVAVPRSEQARLEAAGASECRYITLVDEAWAATDEGAHQRADQLVDEAVGLRRDYELAWLHRYQRARALAEASGPGENPARARLRALVAEIVAIWPDEEWPQQLVGDVAFVERRLPEALRAYDTARQRDPGDARNWVALAECHLLAGREDDAYAALSEALLRNPAHGRANQVQASQYWRLGRTALAAAVNEVARELAPRNPFNHSTHGMILAGSGELEPALAAWQRALDLLPGHLPFVVERARLLARGGRVDEAVAALAAAVAERPGEAALRVDLAELLYRHGRHDAAVEVCKALHAVSPGHAAAHAIAGAAMCAGSRLEPGLAELHQALRRRPSFPWAMSELAVHLGRAGRHAEALFAAAAAFGLTGAPTQELGLAVQLAAGGAAVEAAQRARRALLTGRLVGDEWGRAIDLVVASEGVFSAHTLLTELGRRAIAPPDLLRAHARLLLESFWYPAAASEVLRRLGTAEPQDPLVVAAHGHALAQRTGGEVAEGEALLRAAISKAPASVAPRRWLAASLSARGRHAEALVVLQPCPPSLVEGDLRVVALLGLGQYEEAAALVAALERSVPPSGHMAGVAILRYRLAHQRGDWSAALAFVEQIARAAGERDDDGRLGIWEQAKFECLVRLGEFARARRFGEQQATKADAAAKLADLALGLEAHELANHFCAGALQFEPQQPLALAVRARLATLVRGAAPAAAGPVDGPPSPLPASQEVAS